MTRDARAAPLGARQFRRVQVLDPSPPSLAPTPLLLDERTRLVPRRGAVLTLRTGSVVRRRVRAPDRARGSPARGAAGGAVTVLVDGAAVAGAI